MLFEEMVIGGVIVGIIGTIGFAILCELVPFFIVGIHTFYEYMRFIGSLE